MDVGNLNRGDSFKNAIYQSQARQFSMETYFVWFSALIYITEIITDLCLITYYIHQQEVRWALITLSIIILPLMLCQLCSLLMLRTQQKHIGGMSTLFVHLLLMGIPYRYQSILRKVDKEKMSNQELQLIRQKIREVNTLQMLNAIFQYCPQFIFQAFLIVYKKYKCVITGVSAGLAGFSFIWHCFLHIYYFVRKNKEMHNEIETIASNTRIIDNLTSSQRNSRRTEANALRNGNNLQNLEKSNLSENLKIFEKPMYKTDDKNFVSKKQCLKSVEKSKIFSFNKRKTVYETEDFDLYGNNTSTVFFEVDESGAGSKFNASTSSVKTSDVNNENNLSPSVHNKLSLGDSSDTDLMNIKTPEKDLNGAPTFENKFLKRKGICSSQEMLHLVEIMHDISPEQVDELARSLVEMGGDDSLKTESSSADTSKLLEQFPAFIDDKLMENIEAAIYENQVIFQERIRKNRLTIQNLKLQDQLLSKYIEDVKNLPSNEMINIRDYENMCFANVNRQGRLKHWRNYLQDIDTSMHENSTIQNSSFYVNTNTLSNSLTDLYVNGTDLGSVVTEDGKLSDQISIPHHPDIDLSKKSVRWSEQLTKEPNDSLNSFDARFAPSDSLYNNMFLPQKNILVETINAINVDSPVSHIKRITQALPLSNSIKEI